MENSLRVGIGYDIHPLTPGKKLVLGGVHIPYDEGLEGWSDADVLIHAVIDALLGAAALGDIGTHFPPGEPQYKDISSLSLLEDVKEQLAVNAWHVINVDATIVAESPKLGKYINEMRGLLSRTLGIEQGQISIKASSNNAMGAIGRGEGIAAYAVALIEGGPDEGI